MAGVNGNKAWALAIEARYAAGAVIPSIAKTMASDVLDRPLLRGGKHTRRPDARDRQAGDVDHATHVDHAADWREDKVAI